MHVGFFEECGHRYTLAPEALLGPTTRINCRKCHSAFTLHIEEAAHYGGPRLLSTVVQEGRFAKPSLVPYQPSKLRVMTARGTDDDLLEYGFCA